MSQNPLNAGQLRIVLVDTFITYLPAQYRNVKDHGPESMVSPMLTGMNRNDRRTAETLLTDLGIRGYWSRVKKALVLELPLTQNGTPRSEAATYVAQRLTDAGFPSTVLTH